jgi:hypothetical protein
MRRRLLEDDACFRKSLSKSLARTQIKWNSRPPPVLDLEPNRGVGLRVGLGIDTIFLAVPDDVPAGDLPGTVLAANCSLRWNLYLRKFAMY